MLTTKLGNLSCARVMVRLQNTSRVRPAKPSEIKQLANLLVTRNPEDKSWSATYSDPKSKFGTVVAIEA